MENTHTPYFVACQPCFGTTDERGRMVQFYLGQNVPVHHHGRIIGHHGEFIAGPFDSADAALDALSETSTPDAVVLGAELKQIRPDWFV